ncbi:MAG TPA: recombinase family protein [Azospirillaceae bacterium]|nr:recombinase family protein [Azospirillaceae bacterium]
MTVPRRVAIYARVSTTEQSPEVQLAALRDYAAGRGFVIHGEYIDHLSGDGARRPRRPRGKGPAFDRLMADAHQRRFDCVLVWKYDRFARSLGVLIAALQRFDSLGIDFISYTQSIDTTTSMGRLFFNIIGSFAEFEREMIVERVRAGLANARAKGQVLGRPERDPTAKARIVALRAQGLSLREIARREGRSASGILKILRAHLPAVEPS